MFDMLKDIVERIKKELENEKKVRGDSEETIFTLLELTTQKLSAINKFQ